jgi:methenyltetrahydrofolate cyclohydrolase
VKAFNLSVDEFLKQASSAVPTPGGGSVAALAGALGASMVSMVANLTTGRERFKSVEKEVIELRDLAVFLIGEYKRMAEADIDAFSKLMDAFKLPKEDEIERTERTAEISRRAVQATEVPLAIAEAGLKTLGLAKRIATIGNRNAASDAGVAACLAEAAVAGALLNGDINLPLVNDREYRERTLFRRNSLAEEATQLRSAVLRTVAERMS